MWLISEILNKKKKQTKKTTTKHEKLGKNGGPI